MPEISYVLILDVVKVIPEKFFQISGNGFLSGGIYDCKFIKFMSILTGLIP